MITFALFFEIGLIKELDVSLSDQRCWFVCLFVFFVCVRVCQIKIAESLLSLSPKKHATTTTKSVQN
jgi:hypothetical protein